MKNLSRSIENGGVRVLGRNTLSYQSTTFWCALSNLPRTFERFEGPRKARSVICREREQWRSCLDILANLRVQVDACRKNDGILRASTTSTQAPCANAERQGVD